MAKQETSIDVNVKVNVQVDAHVEASTHGEESASVVSVEYVVPAALLAVAGAIAAAFFSFGMLTFVGLGGVFAVGVGGIIAYDHLPDLLNDWHYRRIHKAEMRLKMLEAQRPVILVVGSEEAKRYLATNPKMIEKVNYESSCSH